MTALRPTSDAQATEVTLSARPDAPFRAEEFATVGVFGLDWLLDPQFTRLLDTIAASPGAIRGVRTFGALSGGRDKTFPTTSAGVWDNPDQAPDFTRTFAALETLVSRRLTPFLPLTFFPPAVSAVVNTPSPDLTRWQRLVQVFLTGAVARFGAAEVAGWWFEVWNEPNMPPFWGSSFDRYLELYRATSKTVLATGLQIRLGGPVLAYMPDEGAPLMERFLTVLHEEPHLKCDFVSLHRKGAWTNEEGEPDLSRLVAAAETTARAVLRLVPERADGLAIVNDEADMMVGFDRPYPPRMTAQSAAWLAASMIEHDRLSTAYAQHRMRFIAASDNANLQLARGPFDGRRMLTTPLSSAPADQVKLPVLAFYELLRVMGDRRGAADPVADGVSCIVTVGDGGIAVLFTRCTGAGAVDLDCVVQDVPWSDVNVVQFRIDQLHTNAVLGAPDPGRMRLAQELGVLAPPRSELRVAGTVRERVRLGPFETALVWITPHEPAVPPAPGWLEASRENGNVVLRWSPVAEASLYSYEVSRIHADAGTVRISPDPLRAAMWIDTAAPAGPLRYSVRAVTVSGVASRAALGEPLP